MMNSSFSSKRIFILVFSLGCSVSFGQQWQQVKEKSFSVYFTETDKSAVNSSVTMLQTGCKTVEAFFGESFQQPFDVYIHPDRHSLDSTWSSDWASPGFKSECWMVASGVARKLDVLSPLRWSSESCEHVWSDSVSSLQLFTHELVHVFQGQVNASPDFSDVTGLDWFVEGLAVWASGQCNSQQMTQVKQLVIAGNAPQKLDDFWTGKLRYYNSGSMVCYVEKQYGHEKLLRLLPFNRKEQVLEFLGVSEKELITGWSEFMRRYTP